jgi:N-acetylglucosamine-6-phosphate deacetylase
VRTKNGKNAGEYSGWSRRAAIKKVLGEPCQSNIRLDRKAGPKEPMKTYLTAATVFASAIIESGVVVIETEGKGGTIAAVGQRDQIEIPAGAKHIDYGDNILAPGFIDLHIHGGSGHDVMEGSPAALAAVEALLARHGVTSYCPTTVTAPMDVTLASLEKLGKAISDTRAGRFPDSGARARPLGVHLEGPFISRDKCGVHPMADIQKPSTAVFEKLWSASSGNVKVMTIAPELPDALEVIKSATSKKVVVSLGHSNADSSEAKAGIAAGARHATHTFNAMRTLNHRDPGILGVVLTDEDLSADIVVDGVHVAPEIVKLFLSAKGNDRSVLITDSISASGMPDGKYRLGSVEVEVEGDRCMLDGKIAGSVLTMDAAVRNIMKFAGWKLARAVRLATENPARVLGIQDKKGSLAKGLDADIVILSPEGKVIKTIVGGVGA